MNQKNNSQMMPHFKKNASSRLIFILMTIHYSLFQNHFLICRICSIQVKFTIYHICFIKKFIFTLDNILNILLFKIKLKITSVA
jgi:hypothetical protein